MLKYQQLICFFTSNSIPDWHLSNKKLLLYIARQSFWCLSYLKYSQKCPIYAFTFCGREAALTNVGTSVIRSPDNSSLHTYSAPGKHDMCKLVNGFKWSDPLRSNIYWVKTVAEWLCFYSHSKKVPCFFSFFILTDLILYSAFFNCVLLLTSINNRKHNACVSCFLCFCKYKNVITGWRNDLSIWYFFAQCIKKRLREPTIEDWVFSKQKLTVRPAEQVLILSHKPAVHFMLIVSVCLVFTIKRTQGQL